ncbi:MULTISPECIES: Spx/MgsR family RNA polymerase-binding regulatory protein [Halomonadaceae]|jgi:Spx/MgsR family transcriptional regulator|uniref:Spx/MgsR family RNA polymerase-binding regulatory protein n=1 Tax=Vreelandella janggokensis TaxID=370767 RepID=A0ABT4IRF1_9GAMM|nr:MULTISPECIES: Spx/MgsR family RNA polymerase-binding regulatory protein [Halomonas]MCW4150163.1 Spx/MgsR family RNA polymerase-binding regulatory protein [Halomonas sp. 18H]MCZ0926248.1 Spx/MgsR family RNA polymerase-binding regulatory protein [Halomonas janggokensis]MCZ0931315.1 Spx/MgsR family RNA polymerase-binding regulatory protein [Halomonas janggokensis]MDR5887651.1 Spx/MgsR family RNA polymerase-binding regulatory protein [Halomonas janggokensis]QPL46702.1 Spx/MgsR family RNA polyme
MLTLYIISNCDTCRKAAKALDEKGIPFKTYDLRKDGLSAPLLEHILHRVPLVKAINKQSKTWRELSDEEKDFDANSGRELLLKHPTLLKRPLLEVDDETILVGYKDGDYDKL